MIPSLFVVTKILLLALIIATLLDVLILFNAKKGVQATRILPEKFSNGDKNPVQIDIKNFYSFPITTKIVDI